MQHLKIYLTLALLFCTSALGALPPKPLPSLPLGNASTVNSSDALIFTNTQQSNLTYRLYLWDLINLPPFSSSSYVLGKPLTGFSSSSGTVTSSDTVKTALEKLAGNSTPSAPVSIGTFDSQTPDAKGLALSSNVLYGQSATATVPGMVNTGTQTFAGVKTFNSTIAGSINGNAATASALASNPADCASNTFATTIAANGDLTCAAVGDSALSSSYVKADGTRGLSADWNAGAHSITATGFVGALTGNASTSSALAADPSDCASDTYATTIAANGNLTCSSVSDTGLATSYLKADGTRGLSGNWNAGAHSITASTFVGALTGNASTATALAANPTDCSAGDFATAIDASGNLTCATPSGASPLTTKGDIYVYSTTNDRLPVGSNNQLLVPDSTASTGMKWTTALPTAAEPAHTGDVTNTAGSLALTIANSAVTNAKSADMAQSTFKGRHAGAGTGAPEDMTATQATAILNLFGPDSGSGGLQGLVTPTGAGDAAARRRLGADGNWDNQGNGAFAAINFATLDTSGNSWANDKPTNADAETTVGDWVAYADSAAAIPVDMTGGSPNTTCARNTSSPLDGAADFKMTVTTGASRQGEGCSLVVNIPVAYRGQAIRVSFPYATTGTIASGDFVPYAYDVTNSSLLAPSATVSGITGTAGTLYSIFSTQTSTAQLRIGLHIARTTTAAATVEFDDVKLEPDLTQANVPLSDWLPFTMSIKGAVSDPTKATSPTIDKAYWRRVGDSIHIRYEYQQTSNTGAAAGSGLYLFTLPNGFVADTSKATASTSGALSALGTGISYDGTTVSNATLELYDTTHLMMQLLNASQVGSANAALNNAAVRYGFEAVVPISGWSSGGGTSPTLSMTDWAPYSVAITGSSSNPTKGTTTIDQGYWKRVGDSMWIRYEYKQTAAGSAGSGTYYFSIPSGYTIDTTKLANPSGTGNNMAQALGTGNCNDGNTQIWNGGVQVTDTTHLYINIASPSSASNAMGSTTCTLSSTVMRYGFEAIVPIAGWTSTSSGTLAAPRSYIRLQGGNGQGGSSSGETSIGDFTTVNENVGPAFTYTAKTTTTGDKITINEEGMYTFSFTGYASSGAPDYGITKNTTQLSTTLDSLTNASEILCSFNVASANGQGSCAWHGHLMPQDVIRVNVNANWSSSANRIQFSGAKGSN